MSRHFNARGSERGAWFRQVLVLSILTAPVPTKTVWVYYIVLIVQSPFNNGRKRMTRLFVIKTIFVGLAFGSSAFGNSIIIPNTGEGTGGTALLVGTTDSNYSLISAPSGVPLTAIATTPNGSWTVNTSTADWISPGSSGNTSWPVGNYDYQTTFSLTGLNPATAELSGKWAADNNACIFLNGASTGQCVGFASFGALTPFSITSGFDAGLNTLDFVVTNGGGPSGVIAEVSGTAAVIGTSAVPEPSSLMLVCAALLSLGVAARLRQAYRR